MTRLFIHGIWDKVQKSRICIKESLFNVFGKGRIDSTFEIEMLMEDQIRICRSIACLRRIAPVFPLPGLYSSRVQQPLQVGQANTRDK
jgi:hypothetical protein